MKHILLFLSISLSYGHEIATWNIRNVSLKNRDTQELAKIYSIITKYDFICVQELRDNYFLPSVTNAYPEYQHVSSIPLGKSLRKERIGFLYKTNFKLLQVISVDYFMSSQLDRLPFICTFNVDNVIITFIGCHITFNKNLDIRRREISEIIRLGVSTSKILENKLIIMGDFNMQISDKVFSDMDLCPVITSSKVKTTIGNSSQYDNILIDSFWCHKLLIPQVYEFDNEMYTNDLRKASREVSDHRPLSVFISM